MERVVTAKYFLVRFIGFSNKEAIDAIATGRFTVDGQPVDPSFRIYPANKIVLDNNVIRQGKKLIYIAYNKPRGIESTMNKDIAGNLAEIFKEFAGIFPVGRLDKESEGLMLLTNDGHLYKDLALSSAEKEKEYVVTVTREVTDEELKKLEEGIVIMGQKTRMAKVFRVSSNTFDITLTQGLNRQIRRMCHKLGIHVEKLIRVRIDTLTLDTLEPGSWRYLDENEIYYLKENMRKR